MCEQHVNIKINHKGEKKNETSKHRCKKYGKSRT